MRISGILPTVALGVVMASVHGQTSIESWHGTVSGPGGVVRPGSSFQIGKEYTTGANSRLAFRPLPGVRILAREKTTFTLSEAKLIDNERDVNLSLQGGSMIVKIDDSDVMPTDFRIRTPLGVCAARGTLFRMTYVPDQIKLFLEVLEGMVFFWGIDGSNVGIPADEVLVISLDGDHIELGDFRLIRFPHGLGGEENKQIVTPLAPSFSGGGQPPPSNP